MYVETVLIKQLKTFFVGKCGVYQIFFVSLHRLTLKFNRHMQTFVGNIEGRLDEKGRIFVPAAYRKMQFMADAEYMEPDGQGRILLQKKNLETIGAQQDVLFVGMLNRFAVWAPETFAAKRLSQSELAARLRAKMSKK